MGMGLFGGSAGRTCGYSFDAPPVMGVNKDDSGMGRIAKSSLQKFDPDPANFTVERVEEVNGNLIVFAKYPNCPTFNGFKLLLIKGLEYNKYRLDPHLLGNGHPVIARFEPNPKGYELAKLCAEAL